MKSFYPAIAFLVIVSSLNVMKYLNTLQFQRCVVF